MAKSKKLEQVESELPLIRARLNHLAPACSSVRELKRGLHIKAFLFFGNWHLLPLLGSKIVKTKKRNGFRNEATRIPFML